jgi:Beta-propeller repeat
MRVCSLLALILAFVPSGTREPTQVAPQLLYGTYLGGRHKDFATAIAVDSLGAAYVAGRTLSPDFPVTQGALIVTSRVNNDDWIGFVTKISKKGDAFGYSTLLGGSYRSSANAMHATVFSGD